MIDFDSICQVIINTVPADGSTIGNQSLLEQLRQHYPQLTDDAFWTARDSLIEQGVLAKGRGRGGAVRRTDVVPAVGNLADQALRQVRSRYVQNLDKEFSSVQQDSPAKPVKAAKPTKAIAATSIEAMEKTLWATADKLRANMDAAEYKHIVLGLIFLKYISDSFAGRRAELERKLADINDDYYLDDSDPEALEAELEDRDY